MDAHWSGERGGDPRHGQQAAQYADVAVLIACYNEAVAIAQVVGDFAASLPDAKVYVYDNNSTDGTPAIVRRKPLQGKGHVVRRMFSDIEAEIYVLVDGDATYDAASAPVMVARLRIELLDMVNAARVNHSAAA